MKWKPFLLTLTIITLSILYTSGIDSVPFHPDESTAIFMSEDVKIFFRDPASLFWQMDKENDLRQKYRQLDAPLSRILIGIGRILAGAPALSADWDWSKTWQGNQMAGALPSSYLLTASRFSVALLYPFSLLLIYWLGKKLSSETGGWLAMFILAGHSIILLHTRRAMSESALVFTLLLSLASMIVIKKRLWLAALPIALAFNAKQTLIGLFLIGIIVQLGYFYQNHNIKALLKNFFLYSALFLIVFAALNPLFWSRPFEAAKAAIQARLDLTYRQTNDFQTNNPQGSLNTPLQKVLSLIAQSYLTPPAFKEVGNYAQQTLATETSYLKNPLHSLTANFVFSGLLFLFSTAGFFVGLSQFIKTKDPVVGLLLISSLILVISLLLMVPNSFQRYYISLIPLIALWSSYAIVQITQKFKQLAIRTH